MWRGEFMCGKLRLCGNVECGECGDVKTKCGEVSVTR